jgi:hypothetical protein
MSASVFGQKRPFVLTMNTPHFGKKSSWFKEIVSRSGFPADWNLPPFNHLDDFISSRAVEIISDPEPDSTAIFHFEIQDFFGSTFCITPEVCFMRNPYRCYRIKLDQPHADERTEFESLAANEDFTGHQKWQR